MASNESTAAETGSEQFTAIGIDRNITAEIKRYIYHTPDSRSWGESVTVSIDEDSFALNAGGPEVEIELTGSVTTRQLNQYCRWSGTKQRGFDGDYTNTTRLFILARNGDTWEFCEPMQDEMAAVVAAHDAYVETGIRGVEKRKKQNISRFGTPPEYAWMLKPSVFNAYDEAIVISYDEITKGTPDGAYDSVENVEACIIKDANK